MNNEYIFKNCKEYFIRLSYFVYCYMYRLILIICFSIVYTQEFDGYTLFTPSSPQEEEIACQKDKEGWISIDFN